MATRNPCRRLLRGTHDASGEFSSRGAADVLATAPAPGALPPRPDAVALPVAVTHLPSSVQSLRTERAAPRSSPGPLAQSPRFARTAARRGQGLERITDQVTCETSAQPPSLWHDPSGVTAPALICR